MSEGTVLLDFFTDWCNPCKKMIPILNKLPVKVISINIEEDPEMASEYKVYSLPTFVLLKDGKEVKRLVGTHSKEVMEKLCS